MLQFLAYAKIIENSLLYLSLWPSGMVSAFHVPNAPLSNSHLSILHALCLFLSMPSVCFSQYYMFLSLRFLQLSRAWNQSMNEKNDMLLQPYRQQKSITHPEVLVRPFSFTAFVWQIQFMSWASVLGQYVNRPIRERIIQNLARAILTQHTRTVYRNESMMQVFQWRQRQHFIGAAHNFDMEQDMWII